MMNMSRKRAAIVIVTGLLVFCAGLAPTPVDAGEPKEYAYILLQGRLTDLSEDHSFDGATIRLKSDARIFESTTDDNGVFVFDRLPVANYEMEIRTADGQRMRSVRDGTPEDPDRKRMKIRFGKGKGSVIRLEPDDDRVAVIVPEPPSNMKRFGKQALIFVGAAVVLAL